ncbi:alpha/beta fold hydrolase [Chloroflexi bacterium TSY]|nr:alpha/beta fold hydrolase [Chloroflexi bacterium TSY]
MKILASMFVLTLILTPLPAYAQGNSTCASDVIVQSGDTLSTIAGRVYGNFAAYNAIVTATNAKAQSDSSYATIANPNVISIGWKLCIPASGSVPGLAPDVSSSAAPATSLPAPTPTPTVQVVAPIPPVIDVPAAQQHPLAIERMRVEQYPGSPIVIEQTLDPGVNYDRYIASYRSDGNKIFALLTIPRGERPASGWPVVVFNHGYIPPEIYRTTERYVAYVDGFARSGYIVFRSDYRGHGFSEGEAEGGYGSPDYTVDILNAVTALKQYPAADPNRIGMWGHSMGGQITLRSMVVTDDIKAGVIWAGVVGSYPDLLARWRRPGIVVPRTIPAKWRKWREDLIAEYGEPSENPAFWASISANTYVADLSGPIQLHHGTADTSVPFEFSNTLDAQIQAVGGTVENYIYPGDNHNLSVNFGSAMARSIAFFDRYVKKQ